MGGRCRRCVLGMRLIIRFPERKASKGGARLDGSSRLRRLMLCRYQCPAELITKVLCTRIHSLHFPVYRGTTLLSVLFQLMNLAITVHMLLFLSYLEPTINRKTVKCWRASRHIFISVDVLLPVPVSLLLPCYTS